METTLYTLVQSSVQTNKILQNLLEDQTQTLYDNKKGENIESSSKPPTQKPTEEDIGQAPSKKRKLST